MTRRRPDSGTSGICAAKATASHAETPELEVWDIENFRRPGERTNREVYSVRIGGERAEMGQERFSRGVPGGVYRLGGKRVGMIHQIIVYLSILYSTFQLVILCSSA